MNLLPKIMDVSASEHRETGGLEPTRSVPSILSTAPSTAPSTSPPSSFELLPEELHTKILEFLDRGQRRELRVFHLFRPCVENLERSVLLDFCWRKLQNRRGPKAWLPELYFPDKMRELVRAGEVVLQHPDRRKSYGCCVVEMNTEDEYGKILMHCKETSAVEDKNTKAGAGDTPTALPPNNDFSCGDLFFQITRARLIHEYWPQRRLLAERCRDTDSKITFGWTAELGLVAELGIEQVPRAHANLSARMTKMWGFCYVFASGHLVGLPPSNPLPLHDTEGAGANDNCSCPLGPRFAEILRDHVSNKLPRLHVHDCLVASAQLLYAFRESEWQRQWDQVVAWERSLIARAQVAQMSEFLQRALELTPTRSTTAGVEDCIRATMMLRFESFLLHAALRKPHLDLFGLSRRIEDIAASVEESTEWREFADPDAGEPLCETELVMRLTECASNIFAENFNGAPLQEYETADPNFLDTVLENQVGTPIALSLVYSAVLWRVGLVAVPLLSRPLLRTTDATTRVCGRFSFLVEQNAFFLADNGNLLGGTEQIFAVHSRRGTDLRGAEFFRACRVFSVRGDVLPLPHPGESESGRADCLFWNRVIMGGFGWSGEFMAQMGGLAGAGGLLGKWLDHREGWPGRAWVISSAGVDVIGVVDGMRRA